MELICNKCKLLLAEDMFYVREGKRWGYCIPCHKLYLKSNYHKKKSEYYARNRAKDAKLVDIIRSAKQHPCMDCGQQFHFAAMDFDHRNPHEKDFIISRWKSKRTTKALLGEIAKCDLVCANCHKHRTYIQTLSMNRTNGYFAVYQRKRRQRLNEIKTNLGPCIDCHKNYPYWVMEFDHLPGFDKISAVAEFKQNANVDGFITEISKCDLLCTNCHRIRTYQCRSDRT